MCGIILPVVQGAVRVVRTRNAEAKYAVVSARTYTRKEPKAFPSARPGVWCVCREMPGDAHGVATFAKQPESQ